MTEYTIQVLTVCPATVRICIMTCLYNHMLRDLHSILLIKQCTLCSSLVECMPGYLVPPGSTSTDSHYMLSRGRAYTKLT